MLQSVFRLFAITISTVIVTIIVVFAVRWLGSAQTYQAPPHDWFKKDFWWIYAAPIDQLCSAADPSTLVPSADWIIRVPIKWNKEEWQIPCPTPRPIQEFLSQGLHRNWLLDVAGTDTWGMDKLIETLTPLEKDQRFAALTHSQKAAKFLRHEAPQWIFSADSPSILRLKLFQSLWLESAVDFWPDFVLTSSDPKNPERLDKYNARELLRRKKRLIWNWVETNHEDPMIPIQGVMTDRPTEAVSKFQPTL